MFELMKIVGLSAVLSAGFVTASEVQPQPGTTGGKIYTDRVPQGEPSPRFSMAVYTPGQDDRGAPVAREGKGDPLGKAPHSACTAQAWPYVAPECLGRSEGGPVRGNVRVITVEQRQGDSTSILVRVPAPELAQR